MKNYLALITLAIPTGAALAETGGPETSCIAHIEVPSGFIQVGDEIAVHVAAVSRSPLDKLEINGVNTSIAPQTFFLKTSFIDMATPGQASVKVHVAGEGVSADCESEPFFVEAVPECGEGQVREAVPVTRQITALQLVSVTKEITEIEYVCRDVGAASQRKY